MRLLDTQTGRFVERDPRTTKYAILSHTWDEIEQIYQEVLKVQESYDDDGRLRSLFVSVYRAIRYLHRLRFTTRTEAHESSTTPLSPNASAPEPSRKRPLPEPGVTTIWYDSRLSPKILNASAFARKNGYRYIWIDSCCIDKTSSSELSESINSMFQWYAGSAVCYTFLADVPSGQDPSAEGSRFRQSRWFTRGWTLQELIAPSELLFLSSGWDVIGSKRQLAALVEEISGIDREALPRQRSLTKFSVARRLSWAVHRETKRAEDRAYSLLGLFGLNMPTLYGEGEGALRRLQEEIMLRIPDQSLFAWRNVYAPPVDVQPPTTQRFECRVYREEYDISLLAPSLDVFSKEAKIRVVAHDDLMRLLGLSRHLYATEYTFSPYGICMEIPVIPLSLYLTPECIHFDGDRDDLYLAILGCETSDRPGHLLGSFCCIPSSPSASSAQVLCGGTVSVFQDGTLTQSLVRLFPLSPATLERCRAHVRMKTVHVSHRGRTTDALEAARDWRHSDVRLMLPEEQAAALRAQGYDVDFRAPGQGPDRTHGMHLLTLANGTHVVHIEYRHTLRRHGEDMTIRAHVTMSSATDRAPEAHPDPNGAAVRWTDFKPWNVSLDDCSVTLKAAGAEVLAVKLGLDFAGPSCYRLRVCVFHCETASR